MELDSGADSVSSTPRSTSFNQSQTDKSSTIVRLMCSFGGKIIPRPHDNQLRYVGGDTRIVAVNRSITYSSLITKLSKLLPPNDAVMFSVKYQLPNEDLDSLITVSTDEDVDNMMDEYDRINTFHNSKTTPRLRLFIFSNNEEDSRSSSISELLDGSRKRESWFLDALNGNAGGVGLERGRSEASSIVSEVPDYLFGLDNDDPTRIKSRVALNDPDPGSPAFGSTSSAPAMPNLPPVKTKMESPVETGPVWNGNPNLSSGPGLNYPGAHNHNTNHAMQGVPVYYVPASPVHPGSVPRTGPVQGPMHGHYVQQYGPPVHGPGQVPVHGPVPVMYTGSGHVYSGGPVYEMPIQGNMVPSSAGPGQPVYYGAKNAGPGLVAAYPGMVMPVKPDDASGPDPGSEPSGLNRV